MNRTQLQSASDLDKYLADMKGQPGKILRVMISEAKSSESCRFFLSLSDNPTAMKLAGASKPRAALRAATSPSTRKET